MLFILTLIGLSGSLQAQLKKEQIKFLNNKIDSLNTIITNERQENTKKNSELNKEIVNLNQNITEKNDIISTNNVKIASQSKEIKDLNEANEALKQTVLTLKDSIDAKNLLIEELNNKKEKTNSIYFEGTVKGESMYDGLFYINVNITKGKLAGKNVNLYFVVGFEDANTVECKGDTEFDGSGDNEGKKIKGKIIESSGEFENPADGSTETKKCYRPIELNWD